ncbi:MAG: helix-turn-helix transcriptional regulator [Bacteroidaceae bacterium]|nr:helix-turn-helix transcriptional regulator [Bacteroidaceae bacterium]
MQDTKDRIRQVMEWTNMSQQEFAEKLQVSPASLSSVFSGRTRPTSLYISAIHREFPQISVNWLMFGEGQMLLPTTDYTALATDLFSQSTQQVASETLSKSPQVDSPSSSNGSANSVSADQLLDLATPNPSNRHRRSRYADRAQQPAEPSVPEKSHLEALREITNSFDKQERSITEIRVFYDNGTYESFFPSLSS